MQNGSTVQRKALAILGETARPAGGSNRALWATTALIVIAGCAPSVLAQTLPQGGVVKVGSALISSTATRMDITTSSNRTAIDWNSFSIGAGNQVSIQQPTVQSVTVNRVTGADPSKIFGDFSSNGQVVLSNTNGIWIGPNAHIDVAGIVATTNRLTDSGLTTFANGGALVFDGSAGGASSILNQGAITVADGGLAGLAAPGVRNAGVITARLGSVVLASGTTTTVDFYGDGLINLAVSGQATAPTTAVDGSALTAAVRNDGQVIADGGNVQLSANVAAGVLNNVIDMSGVVQARGVTTAGGVVEILGGTGSVSVAGTVDVSGQAGQAGGVIKVQAASAAATQDGIADLSGDLNASSDGGAGGQISVLGRIVTPSGQLLANGASGGAISIAAATVIQSGALAANGVAGSGGVVTVDAASNILQTSYATTSANSASGAGGAITLGGADTARVFGSGAVSATGGLAGGDITLLGGSIGLAAASLDASGETGGGQILIGGGLHGQGLPTATTTEINAATTLNADAKTSGAGGTIVAWSDSQTVFQGSATARGGATGGDGGLIEVSSADQVGFTGSADAAAPMGKAGTLLLDPKAITITANAGNVAEYNLIDPDSGLGTGFGTQVQQLSNGTVLVTKPGDTVGGSANAGSVFYFNPTTGALLASFQGSHVGDKVGSGVLSFLNYTNYANYYYLYTAATFVNDPSAAYLIPSPNWNGGAGAITWVAANSTVSGVLSSSNSLVGSSATDSVGSNGVYMTPNDNFVVFSPSWANGKGAATFGTVSAGVAGVVSASNSLVGSTVTYSGAHNTLSGDAVGSGGLILLTNGNFVVLSPNWNSQAGAVTFGSETTGLPTGVVSNSNSLVGATGAVKYVGTNLNNGNSQSDSFYGGDQVGYSSSYITPLADGDYVVVSPYWGHDKGAVTIGSGTTGIAGTVSTVNSLTGTTAGVGTGGVGTGTYNGSTYYTNDYGTRYDYGGDQLGSNGVVQLSNGNFVISSPGWNQGEGAVTFVLGSVTALGTGGSLATVTSANSLTGTTQSTTNFNSNHDAGFTGGDSVGNVTGLANGNYAVSSYSWNGTQGAVTLVDGTNGHTVVGSSGSAGDTVSASNSLVGSSSGDYIGTVTPLTGSSNFIVSSTTWSGGKGEVTRVSGTAGIAGAVSSSNSLVGVTGYQTANDLGGDQIGSSILPLANGDWVIESPNWSMTKGAVTFELASATPTGHLSSANSLVGSTAGSIYCTTCNNGQAAIFGGDAVGSAGVFTLSNGNLLVLSPSWGGNQGAITYANGSTGALLDGTSSLTGTISSSNSLVGGNAGTVKVSAYNSNGYSQVGLEYYLGGDQIGASYYSVYQLANGDFAITNPLWNSQTGAVTFGRANGTFAGGGAFVGAIDSSNSLVGSTAGVGTAPADPTTANYTMVGGDEVGVAGVQPLTNSNFLVFSSLWNDTAGAVTWGSGTSGVTGVVSSSNSLVGDTTGDQVGTLNSYGDFTLLPNGDYVINSPNWNGGAGATTWSQGTGAITGQIAATNSLLGATAANVSAYSYASTNANTFFVTRSADNGGVGVVTVVGTDPTTWNFASAQAETLTIAPSLILATLNAGTAVDLQADNDITVNSPLIANANSTGALTLDAGRNVLVHANIDTGDGALTLIGNDTVADGVINAQRAAGTAAITVNNSATLSSGAGALTINLMDSTDKTNNAAGNVTLNAVSGATVTVTDVGAGTRNLILAGNVTATAGGTSIVLAASGVFDNAVGANVLNPGAGRYLVYSADPRNNTMNGLTDPTHYFGETYAANAPNTQPTSGNIYLYSVTPMLTVTASNGTVGYGVSASALTATITGYIDGDTASGSVSGAASVGTSYVAGDAVGGSYATTATIGTLTSAKGYGFSFTPGSITVTPEALTIALTGSVSKTYDGGMTAALASGNYQLTGLYGSDSISVTKTAGAYGSANVGTGLSVSTTLASGDFSAGSGTTLSNYTLPTGSLSGNVGAITAKTLTASLTGSITKPYDGGAAATLASSNYSLSGLVGSQSITVGQTSGSYGTYHVGTGLSVSATLASGDFTAGSGTALSNYSLPTSAAGNIGAVTAKTLTASLTGSITKTYDGGNSATLAGANYSLTGLASGETIGVTKTSATYGGANVGSGISVSTTLASGDYSAGSGTALSDYNLPTGSVSGAIGAITAKTLTASLTGTTTKTYDGGLSAALTTANYSLSGLVGSQSITVGQTSGSYTAADVGGGLSVGATLASGDFTAGSGTLLSNYTLPTTASGNIGSITAKTLTVSLASGSVSRVYNGGLTGTISSGSFQITGLVGSQSITVASGTGTYGSADVGTGISVSTTLANGDFAAGSGTSLSNYVLPVGTLSSNAGVITAAPLSVALTGSVSKTYDAGDTATLAGANYSLTGLVSGESIGVTKTAGTYGSVNAASGISVSTTLASGDFTAGSGTSLSNYTLPTGSVSGTVGVITAKTLTASLTGTTTKTYDGGLAATLTGANYSLSGLIGGQSITVGQTAGTYGSANVGSGLGVSATLASSDFTAGSGTLLGNYALPTTAAGNIGAITPATLSVSLLSGSVSKTYDGGNTALIPSGSYQITGLVGGQSIGVAQTTGTYGSSNAGSGLSVSGSLSSGDFSAGSGTLLSNYVLPTGAFTASNAGVITPATLSVSLVSGSVSKTYDGGNAATISSGAYQLTGLVGGQSIGVAQTTGTYGSPNAGAGLSVTGSLSSGDFSAGSGTLLSNYVLPTGAFTSNAGVITPATLSVSLVNGAVSKTYDGGNTATIASGSYQLTGLVGGQSINVAQTTGTYGSANAGSGIAVTGSLANGDFSAGSGTLLSNYVLPTGSFTSNAGVITPATLSVSLINGAVSKTYDGAATATISSGAYQLTGLVGGQSINVAQTSGTYGSTNAGSGIAVTGSLASGDFSAGSGTLLSNYVLPTGGFASNAGVITPATLSVSLAGGSVTKTYDGGAAATIPSSSYQLTGLVEGQSIGVAQTSGTYGSTNAGSGIAVTGSLASGDFSAGSGTLLSNYVLPTGSFTSNAGVITPATLSVSLVSGSVTKTYDGAATATIPSGAYQLTGLVGGQSINVAQTSGTYGSTNAGSGIAVTGSLASGDFSAGSGTLLSNYVLPTGSFASNAGVITPATLSVSLVGGSVTKTYDGGAAAIIPSSSYQLTGLVEGQSIGVAQTTGTYGSTNAGSGIAVTGSLTGGDFSAGSGTLLSNYVLPTGSFTSNAGVITPATLSVSLVGGSVSKTYDGAATATIPSGAYQLTGLVGDQSINVAQTSGTYGSTNAGSGIAVTGALVNGDFSAGSGTQLSNYVLPTGGFASNAGVITPATLGVSLIGSVSKSYDGGNAASLDSGNYQLTGLASGQSIAITQTAGVYTSANASGALGVTANLASSDFSAGNGVLLSNYVLPTQVSGAVGAITPAVLNVSVTSGSVSKVYDGGTAATVASNSYQLTGLVAGQSISVTPTAGQFASANVGGSVGLNVSLTSANFTAGAGTSLSNYALPTGTVAGAVGAITPATLTVTADSLSKTAGAPNPALTVSYGGFVGGDTAASLTTPASSSTAATTSSAPGAYAITPSGAVDPNYGFIYVNGVLSVTSLPVQDPTTSTIQNSVATSVAQLSSSGGQQGVTFSIGQSVSFLPVSVNTSAGSTAPAPTPNGAGEVSPAAPSSGNNSPVNSSSNSVADSSSSGGGGQAAPQATTSSEGFGHARLGQSNADRDAHSYANDYLNSIGLGGTQ